MKLDMTAVIFFSFESTIQNKVNSLKEKLENDRKFISSNNLKINLQTNNENTIFDSIKCSNLLVCLLTHKYCQSREHVKLIEYSTRIRKRIVYIILETFENEHDMFEIEPLVQESMYVIQCLQNTHENDWTDFDNIKSTLETILNVNKNYIKLHI